MEAGKFSFKFSRQTQKNLVGSSKYAYFRCSSKLTFEWLVDKWGVLNMFLGGPGESRETFGGVVKSDVG
jgi:hypothetical protein